MKTKRFLGVAIIALALLSTSMTVSAQTKAEKKALKNEVKGLVKEGWKVNPGYLTLEEQIIEGKKILKDQDHWVVGEAKATGNVYDAVRSNALYQAKVNIVTNIDLKMGGKEEGGNGNDQGAENSAAASRYREAAKAKFVGEIKHPRYLMDCYRDLKGGKVEVHIRLAIPKDEAEKSYNDIMKEIKEMLNKMQ